MWQNLTEFEEGLLQALGTAPPQLPVQVETGGKGICLQRTADGWQVRLGREEMLGRAAALLEQYADRPAGWQYREEPAYGRLGVMVDCSRNAVPRPETLKKLLQILSRMGYQTVQLYLEDVYQLDGYPYFGHGRGRYTKEELKEVDAFARQLGIELIPAIQTLAHLGQSLKWKAMKPLTDVGDILLIGAPETQALLEAMFRTLAECFTTRRVNIGMDEAHMLGLGRYLDQNGYENRMSLMLRHFKTVHAIARSYGFAPMMWSDMFFRLAAGGEYYAPECTIDPAVAHTIPADTSLIYWDYYSQDAGVYDRMLARHRELSPHIIFAGGAWKWSGFAPCNRFSIHLAGLAHTACVKHGVTEVLVTLWGDNGAECPLFAVLPSLACWAQLCWTGQARPDETAALLQAAAGGRWEDFLLPDELVFTPDNPAPGRMAVNATKTLLYEDLLTPLFSPALDLPAYEAHLRQTEQDLAAAENRAGRWRGLFTFYRALADALAHKAHVQQELHTAWQKKEKPALASLCIRDLPALRAAMERFSEAFRRQWLADNKAPGLDIFDLRIGGQLERIDSARRRLESWLAGETDTVEELEIPYLPFDPDAAAAGQADVPAPFWHRIISPIDITLI